MEQYIEAMQTFLVKQLDAPKDLCTPESAIKMVAIVFPCSIRKYARKHEREIAVVLKIFKENSIKLRDAFFSDPLIKYLWSEVFIKRAPEICITHLRRIRSVPHHGEARFNKLLQDMKRQEVTLEIKLLPMTSNVNPFAEFTAAEKLADLEENGFRNRKESTLTIQQKIADRRENLECLNQLNDDAEHDE